MERDKLICCLVGLYCGQDKHIQVADLKIKIDNHLIACNLVPVTTQEDADLLQDLLDETIWSVLSKGVNRQMRRS